LGASLMISYTQLTGFSLSCFSRHIDITDVILQRSKKKKKTDSNPRIERSIYNYLDNCAR